MASYIVDQEMNLNGNSYRYSDISEIQNFNAPSQVSPSTPFNISYSAYNKSSQVQTLWGKIIDTGNNSIMPGSNWEQSVQPGYSYASNVSIPGITSNLNGIVQIGHIGTQLPDNPIIGIIATAGIIGMVGLVSMPGKKGYTFSRPKRW